MLINTSVLNLNGRLTCLMNSKLYLVDLRSNVKKHPLQQTMHTKIEGRRMCPLALHQ
jgi:hypothetical protein